MGQTFKNGVYMETIIVENYECMSQTAAIHLIGKLAQGYYKRTNVSLTAGQTPVRTYELIHDMLRGVRIPHIHYYNFDEIPLEGRDEGLAAA